jgi:PAS domain S-box-containing protein
MSSSSLVMAGSYDYRIVLLSILISILAAYAARDLSERISDAAGRVWLAWLVFGAWTDGIGTWSMHYTAMMAFKLPVPVQYDWPTVLVSLLVSILGSGAALFIVGRRRVGWTAVAAGGVFLGCVGISGLHYTAMAAMRLQAMHHYSPVLVILSVALAVVISLAALWQTFLVREDVVHRRLRRHGAALLRGSANPVMHYTAMAAVTFTYSALVPDLSHAVPISPLAMVGISIVPVMLLVVTLLTSLIDRLQKQKALLDELFEQAPQAVVLMDGSSRTVRVNREFVRIFGYTPEDAVGRPLSELIVPEAFQSEFQLFCDLLSQGKRVDSESIRRRKDESPLHVSIVQVPVSLPGRQIAAYAMYQDITERKQAEEELQQSFAKLRALAARLQSTREEERIRVAREIHDELGQALTAIKIDVASLVRDMPADQRQQKKAESVLRLVDDTIQSVRRIATELRPGILDDLGLVAAIEWASEDYQSRTGISCRVDVPENDLIIDPERATAIFRIFQETLTNIARHANATQADIRLSKENSDVVLEVRDNGRGIDQEQLSIGRSFGILGMRERALLLGGELTISGEAGKGTVVRVRIPDAGRAQAETG